MTQAIPRRFHLLAAMNEARDRGDLEAFYRLQEEHLQELTGRKARPTLDAFESRLDAVKRKCKTGYSCGNACISLKKECRREPLSSLSRERAEHLMALARGEIKPRGIGNLKPQQRDQLTLEINKFQRTGIKPAWYVEPGSHVRVDDELDVSTPEARMAFVKHMRARSIARPGASYDGNTLAAALLKLCDQPGEVGRNARRMAKFLMKSNVMVAVDNVAPHLRRDTRIDGPIKDSDMKHLLSEEVSSKVGVNNPGIMRVIGQVVFEKNRVKYVKEQIQNLKASISEDRRMGWETPAVTQEALEYQKQQLQQAKDKLQLGYRTLAAQLMGKPGAGGLAHYNGILCMLDDPDYIPWSSAGFNPEDMTKRFDTHVSQFGQPGYKVGVFTHSFLPTRNDQIMATFIHEVGHMVQFASGDTRNTVVKISPALEGNIRDADPGNPLGGLLGDTRHFVSDYAMTNRLELFAESFAAFVVSPAALRQRTPEVYDWVDDVLRRAQATPIVRR